MGHSISGPVSRPLARPIFQPGPQTMVLLIMAASAFDLSYASSTSVLACKDHQGHMTFTDLGCPRDIVQSWQIELDNSRHYYAFKPLSEADQSILDPSPRQRRQTRLQQTQRQRQAESQLKLKKERQRGCTQAQSSLQDLRDKRRKGYRLREARALQQLEGSIKEQIAELCD